MDEFDRFIEDHFIDAHGVVYSQIDVATLQPLQDDFFRSWGGDNTDTWGGGWGEDHFSAAEYWSYENCGMCTGAYLNSLCCALRLPGIDEEDVRRRAKRTFDGLVYIYRIGQAWERGFFPKIWGNRLSHQTSTDQVLYAMHSMHNYYPFSSAEDRKSIEEMIPAMAEFWMNRNYVLSYYHVKDMVWPPLRFPSFLMLAWKYSGKEKFRKEALRILDENIGRIPENSRRKHGSLYAMADAITMDTMNHEILLDFAPVPEHYRKVLLDGLRIMWEEGKATLTPDGFHPFSVPCDPITARPTAGPEKNGPRMAWSTMVVRAGLEMARLLPDLLPETMAAAEIVLKKLRPEEMYYYHPADAEKLPEKNRYKACFLSGDAIANRQWALHLYQGYQQKAGTEK